MGVGEESLAPHAPLNDGEAIAAEPEVLSSCHLHHVRHNLV